MMKISGLYELTNKNSCVVKRSTQYSFSTDEKHIQKSALIKSIIKNVEFSEEKPENIDTLLEEGFKEIPYLSEKQRMIHEADAAKQIKRYVQSETRKLYPCKNMSITCGDLTVENVHPDAVTYGFNKLLNCDTIEVIRYKCKKPDVTQSSAGDNLELYFLLKYAESFVKFGEKAVVKASFYFLKKKNDSNTEGKECFDTDFFNNKGGLNIVSLTEEYTADGSETDMDRSFAPIIGRFATGIPEDMCSESDCASCELKPICKFSDPPMVVPVPLRKTDVSSIRLTPNQRDVKEYEKGIVRINAGAGAGKSLVIVLRINALLNKGVKPEEIMATTFTNAGAKVMADRIETYAEDDGIADEVDIHKIRIQTFNAFGNEIVRENYKKFGYTEEPNLMDDIDKFKIVSDMLKDVSIEGLDYRNFEMNQGRMKGAVAVAVRAFEVFKNNPTLGLADIDLLYDKADHICNKNAFIELYRLYGEYDQRLRDNNLIEFSDQENLVLELLGIEPYYFEKYGIKHIIVDEFQDTSDRQIEILKRLTNTPSFESLMVVGDDSQAIYSFRDTTPYYIINFDKIMGCKIDDISLLENHRSTPEIIEFANKINALNTNRIPKDLIATRPSGKPVTVQGFLTADEEREYIVSKVKEHIENGEKPEDISILARNKTELNKMADLLAKNDIPSVVQFPEKLSEDSRVQAAISMLRAIRNDMNTTDRLIYANALLHATKGGTLRGATSDEIEAACEEADIRIRAYRAVTDEEEKKEALESLFKEIDPNEDSLYQSFVSGLMLRNSEKIFQYCEDFSLFGQNVAIKRTGNYPGVVLSTAHSSKGLEWPICFNMIGGYDKPELHTMRKVERIEEERRLLFVSCTRARDILYVTAPYTCGGKAGAYIYNQFLMDCYKVNGQEFSTEKIEKERFERKEAKKKQKEKKNEKSEAVD